MATNYKNNLEESKPDEHNVLPTTTENPVQCQQLINSDYSKDKRNQLQLFQTKQKYNSVPLESKPNDRPSRSSLNANKDFVSIPNDKHGQLSHTDYNHVQSFESERQKESVVSDHSSFENVESRKSSNYDVSSKPHENTCTMHKDSQNAYDDSSHDSKTQTTVSDNVIPLSPTKKSKRQLSESTPEDKTQTLSKSDSSPADTRMSASDNPGSRSLVFSNTKPSTTNDTKIYTKQTNKSIISSGISASSLHMDNSRTNEPELPELAPVCSDTSSTSDNGNQNYHGDDKTDLFKAIVEPTYEPDKYQSPPSKQSRTDKEQDQSHEPFAGIYPSLVECEENDRQSTHRIRRRLQRTSQHSSILSQEDPQISEASSSCYLPNDNEDDYLAYIPCLPSNDFKVNELQSIIRRNLQDKHQLHAKQVKCNFALDFGVVYLGTKEDKDRLVNIIKQMSIQSKLDRSISFVAELEFISYVVITVNDPKDIPRIKDIRQHLIQLYPNYHLSKCQQLWTEFLHIFQIVTNKVENMLEPIQIREFTIEGPTATVYFRADWCFIDALPRDTTAKDIYFAIDKQIGHPNISTSDIYVCISKTKNKAIVLTCNEAKIWRSYHSIELKGEVLMKEDQLIYDLRLRSVPDSISLSSIKCHKIFANTVFRTTYRGKDLVVELLNKDVYENCLQKRVLYIDGHAINIEPNGKSNIKNYGKIDASNWYETEMENSGSSIVEFIVEPEHRIFHLQWDSQAFLEQFRRCSLQNNASASSTQDYHGSSADRYRHLLRMTVMLNTIGVIKRGSYSVNGKEIRVTSDKLRTIVYNHQSTLEQSMTVSSSQGIDYPYKSTIVQVKNADCLVAYEKMHNKGYRPLLLNMANAHSPGGGYRKGDGAQEENIFRRSNYYRSLDMELDQGEPTMRFLCSSKGDRIKLSENQTMYPMDDFGAIYTSGLTVFRQPEDKGYEFMDEPIRDVCAIAIAAYRKPQLNHKNLLCSKYSIGTRKKIETIFAIAKHHNHDCLILSAFGCGAFRNPPKHVATIFESVIKQYAGFFKHICFAIIDDHNTGQDLNPHGNYKPFYDLLGSLEVKPSKHITVDTMIGPWRILKETRNKEIVLSNVQISSLPLCHYGGTCREIESQSHCQKYLHPPMCPLPDGSKACDNDDHILWFKHRPKHSHSISSGSNDQIDQHRKRHVDNIPLCPWTPFHCQQYTLLTDSSDTQTLPLDVQKHCRAFRHICQFGRQCYQQTNSHWETTIHIARDICRDGEKCWKIDQENHLNSFSHPRIADIRRLCAIAGYECRDRDRPDHIHQYRHRADYCSNSIIPYRGVNRKIHFIQNQQDIMATIRDYDEHRKVQIPLSIPYLVLKCIQGLSPVYQCSKDIFQLILVHGNVMSDERIAQLTDPLNLIEIIKENKHIQSIIARPNYQMVEGHIHEYIKAIVLSQQSQKVNGISFKTTEYTSSYSSTTMANYNFDDIIRKEEKFLKEILGFEEMDTIRQWTLRIAEVSLDFSKNSYSAHQSTQKYISTIFGPRLCQSGEDIVLVFKREVMFHPDTKFSLQTSRQLKKAYQLPLHCSVYGYKEAAIVALMSTNDTLKTMNDIDLKTVLRYLANAKPHQLFEGYLPELIPLDYIEEVYIPETLFNSLTSSAQMSAKQNFRNALHLVPRERNGHQDYVNQKLIQKLEQYTERSHQQLSGTTITLSASHLTEYVTLAFTLSQAYDQYRRNYKRGPLSDDIYIYWQAMHGDMMVILSNDPIDCASDSQYNQSLVCYVAETPSTATNDYNESYSYINFGHPSQHKAIMKNRSFLIGSNEFYHGCNIDQYLTYCLKLEKLTGQVTLFHAGPNSIYNNEIISCQFVRSKLNLNDLEYIYITANSEQVPVRNFMVCFHKMPDLHPAFEKRFHPTDIASRSVSSHCSSVSKDAKSSNVVSVVKHKVNDIFGRDFDQKKQTPCRDSINCLQQTSQDHCKKYSHPCRFSELCWNKDKEPHLTHEVHRVKQCSFDTSCCRRNDPYHRANNRHTDLPDFLIPCRDQTACRNRSEEHRIKYSHGEKINLSPAVAIENPKAAAKQSTLSSENYSNPLNRSSSQERCNENGSMHHNKANPSYGSQRSHSPNKRPGSSVDHNCRRTLDRFDSSEYQPKDANDSASSTKFTSSPCQSIGIDYNEKQSCPLSIKCNDFSTDHLARYSHVPK